MREYEDCIALTKPREDRAAMLATSASTLDRVFRGLPRVKPFAARANRRSGLNRPVPDAIECKRGMHNAVEALKRLERCFPFPITSEHEDNGRSS